MTDSYKNKIVYIYDCLDKYCLVKQLKLIGKQNIFWLNRN